MPDPNGKIGEVVPQTEVKSVYPEKPVSLQIIGVEALLLTDILKQVEVAEVPSLENLSPDERLSIQRGAMEDAVLAIKTLLSLRD